MILRRICPLIASYFLLLTLLAAPIRAAPVPQPKKHIVFISGARTHAFGEHEYFAGCTLLANRLRNAMKVNTTVFKHAWPPEGYLTSQVPSLAAVVIYCSGDQENCALGHESELDALASKGVGIGFIHWSTEMPSGGAEEQKLISWIGGAMEKWRSMVTFWTASIGLFPVHPVSRGLSSYSTYDEWYTNLRFRAYPKVIPIVTAQPPKDMKNPWDDPAHNGTPSYNANPPRAALLWVSQTKYNRAFGYVGGHYHWGWAKEGTRKAVLNAISWIAGLEVPAKGVVSAAVTLAELKRNLDPKPIPEGWSWSFLDKWLKN